MDNELDKKLRELFIDAGASEHTLLVKSLVQRAKAAFSEAGYSQTTTHASIDDNGKVINTGTILMTGQEWYDRFEKELKFNILCLYFDEDESMSLPVYYETDALLAARRAAGLSERQDS